MNPALLIVGGLAALILLTKRGRGLAEDVTDAASAAMGEEMLSDHFTLKELTTTSTGLNNTPNEEQLANLRALAVDVLEPLRAMVGDTPIRVSSGFRSSAVNKAVGGSKTSDHMTGRAADIYVSGMTNSEVAAVIYDSELPVDQVIVEHHTGHLHIGAGGSRREFLQTYDGATYSEWQPETLT